MRASRLRSFADAVVVFACEIALVVFFWKSASLFGSVDVSHFSRWLGSAAPVRVLTALARLLGLAVSTWLLLTSCVYALGALGGKKVLLKGSKRLTLPIVRRAVDALTVASVTASTIGSAAGGAFASPARVAPIVQPYVPADPVGARAAVASPAHVRVPVWDEGQRALESAAVRAGSPVAGTEGTAGEALLASAGKAPAGKAVHVQRSALGRHLPHPGSLSHDPPPKGAPGPPRGVVPSVENGFAGLPRGTKVVVVQPGDCLSVIAERYLGDWRLDTEIAELNYGRLQPDGLALVNDHWIYPGWVLIMPPEARGALVVGGTAPTHSVAKVGEAGEERAGGARGEAGGARGEHLHGSSHALPTSLVPSEKSSIRSGDEVNRRESAAGEACAPTPRHQGIAGRHVPAGTSPAPRKAPESEYPAPQMNADGGGKGKPSGAGVTATSGTELGGAGGEGHVGARAVRVIAGYQGAREQNGAGGERGAGTPTKRAPDGAPPEDAGRPSFKARELEVALTAGLGVVAAAGVVWKLQRARRERAQSRPHGFVPAGNRPEVRAAERRARAVASEEAMRWVDLGARYLGALIEQAAHAGAAAGALERRLAQAVTGPEGWSPPADQGEVEADEGEVEGGKADGAVHGEFARDYRAADWRGEEGWELVGDEAALFDRWWTGEEAAVGDREGGEEGQRAPSLVMVRVGACGLEVVLEPAPAGRLGWFVPIGGSGERSIGGSREQEGAFVLSSDLGLEDLATLAAERWPAWPALVAVGESEGDTVLLNLEHAGVLSVEGPTEQVNGFLAGVLLQLASQPWAEEMLGGLYAVGEGTLEGPLPGRAQRVAGDDAMELAERLDVVAAARQELAGGSSLSVMRALACEALPNVAVAFRGTPANALQCLAEAAVPERSGVVLVAAGPVEGADWRLELGGGGAAVLRGQSGGKELAVELVSVFRPEEVALLSEALSRPEGEGFVELRGEVGTFDESGAAGDGKAGSTNEANGKTNAADGKTNGASGRGTLAGERAPGKELAGAGSLGAEGHSGAPVPTPEVPRPDVEIRFLGPVDVVGGDMDAVGSNRIMAALGLLAYLAAHPRPVPADELASALWPLDATKDNFGGPQRKTVMNVVSRARSVLGYGANGKERLVLTPRGYRLAGDVGSDWDRFRRYVSIAHGLGRGPEAMAQLRAAIELVRGEPFGGVLASQFFEWVASEHLDMVISAHVVDVAEELGELALGAGDLGLVYWAVERGLQIEPTREELFRLWMHALGREGRPARVDDVYRRLKLVLRQRIHPLQEPQPASREVWQRYLAMEGAPGR